MGRDGFEQIIFRGGWGQDDTHIGFRCGDQFTAHQHDDIGHVDLYHKGALLADSGHYAAGVGELYASRTIAHNSILVLDPQEREGRMDFADGGQRRLWITRDLGSTQRDPFIFNRTQYLDHQTHPPHFETGRVLHFEDNSGWSYAAADITDAYNSVRVTTQGQRPKVRSVRRDVLYLRDAECLIVLDRVSAVDPAFKKSVLWQTVTPPRPARDVLGADVATALPDGAWVLDAGPDPQGQPTTGRALFVPLLPAEAQVQWVGGDDMRFMNGEHRSELDLDNSRTQRALSPLRENGNGRLVVSPPEPRPDDVFLSVFVLGDRDTLAVPVMTAQVAPKTGDVLVSLDDLYLTLALNGVKITP